MSGETMTYFVALSCVSAALAMNAYGLWEKRQSIAQCRAAGDVGGERVYQGHFRGQMPGAIILALAAVVCLFRFVQTIGRPTDMTIGFEAAVLAVLSACFLVILAMLAKQRRMKTMPPFASGPALRLLVSVNRATICMSGMVLSAIVMLVILIMLSTGSLPQP